MLFYSRCAAHSFIVSCTYHVTVTSFSVFYFYYRLKNNLCLFHMETFLPSSVCLISTALAYLITVTLTSLLNDVKNGVNLYLPALAHQALHRKRTW